ncbi:hypothetical protein FVI09_25715 [Escherichia coli]|nr:hypothetical protein [Escherichia coli]
MKKTAPDGAVSGMPAIRETGPGKNLQAITVSMHRSPRSRFRPASVSTGTVLVPGTLTGLAG